MQRDMDAHLVRSRRRAAQLPELKTTRALVVWATLLGAWIDSDAGWFRATWLGLKNPGAVVGMVLGSLAAGLPQSRGSIAFMNVLRA